MGSIPFTGAVAEILGGVPQQPNFMGFADAALTKAARNQQAYGPWVFGQSIYMLQSNANADATILMLKATVTAGVVGAFASLDLAHAPFSAVAVPGFAPFVLGTTIFVAYCEATDAGGLTIVGIKVRAFDTTTDTWGVATSILPNSAAGDTDTFDILLSAANNIQMVYSRNVAGGVTELRSWNGAVWSAATTIGAEITHPVMTGFAYNPATQKALVFYSQALSFAVAWPVPNPTNMVQVDLAGGISAPVNVIANGVSNVIHSPFIQTYPAIDSVAFIGNTYVASFADASAGTYQPAIVTSPDGGLTWPNNPTILGDLIGLTDRFQQGVVCNTIIVNFGGVFWCFWCANNTEGSSGDGSIDQINYATSNDGVVFSATQLLWDAIANPAPNFKTRANGGILWQPSVAPIPFGLFPTAGFLISASYIDSVNGFPQSRAFFATVSAPGVLATIYLRDLVTLPLPDPRANCKFGEIAQCERRKFGRFMMRTKSVLKLR